MGEEILVFLHDIRMTGSEDKLHLEALKIFFQKSKAHKLKLNLGKFKIFKKKLNFLGHTIDANGLHKTDDKISAILKAPRRKCTENRKCFMVI